MIRGNCDRGARFRDGTESAGLDFSFWAQTFNRRMLVYFDLETSIRLKDFRPALRNAAAGVDFWLVRVAGAAYAWAGASSAEPSRVQVLSKAPLPDGLGPGCRPFKLEVLQRMSDRRIRDWASRTHFFQGFSWLPPGTHAANSGLVWDAIAARASFAGKSVLDIGTNFGYHAFRASRAGALVAGQDRNPNVLKVARLINDRIEMQDVEFGTAYDEGAPHDIVLYLSVHHQADEGYAVLGERIRRLRSMARERVFVELIVPPIRGGMSERDVDRIVGGEKLLRYRHKVRRERAIYDVPGGN